jgi:hypothetical protein
MSFVVRNGEVKKVKNLGWLLRNWQLVESLDVIEVSDRSGWLVAQLNESDAYSTQFADITVLNNWINRPVFRGLEVRRWELFT